MSYQIQIEKNENHAVLFRIGFGPDPAKNDELVRSAEARLAELAPEGGPLALLNGPASLPVACVLAHKLGYLYGAVAVWDPKMAAYVVAISHDPDRPLGSVVTS